MVDTDFVNRQARLATYAKKHTESNEKKSFIGFKKLSLGSLSADKQGLPRQCRQLILYEITSENQ